MRKSIASERLDTPCTKFYRLRKTSIDVPSLFICALRDPVLTPGLSEGMDGHFTQLTRKEVDSSHFALWEKPQDVNTIITEWLQRYGLFEKGLDWLSETLGKGEVKI